MVSDERLLLGAMIHSRNAVATATELCTSTDLADHRLRAVWDAVVELDRQGVSNQPQQVLRSMGHEAVAKLGGDDELVGMWVDAPTSHSASYYAKRVAASAARRRVAEAALGIQNMANAAGEDVDPHLLLEEAYEVLDGAKPGTQPDVGQVGDSLDAVLASLEDKPRFLTTPWAGLNGLINGFRPGGLYVVGARPGQGKTIVGLQAAAHLATWGNVAFSSLEMQKEELTRRLIAQRAGVHMTSIATNTLNPADWQRVAKAHSGIMGMPLFIDDRSGITMAQVRSHVRSVSRRGHLAAVVVDYLQLLRSADPRRPRWEQVTEFSRSLKVLAREYDVPVIALAQLNRESEAHRRQPGLADLRESGSIEQDADVVILMQRGFDDAAGVHTDDLDLIVAKNRHGLTGKTTLLWEGQFARLTDSQWV